MLVAAHARPRAAHSLLAPCRQLCPPSSSAGMWPCTRTLHASTACSVHPLSQAGGLAQCPAGALGASWARGSGPGWAPARLGSGVAPILGSLPVCSPAQVEPGRHWNGVRPREAHGPVTEVVLERALREKSALICTHMLPSHSQTHHLPTLPRLAAGFFRAPLAMLQGWCGKSPFARTK